MKQETTYSALAAALLAIALVGCQKQEEVVPPPETQAPAAEAPAPSAPMYDTQPGGTMSGPDATMPPADSTMPSDSTSPSEPGTGTTPSQ
jgi:hypothetical protein